MLSRIALITLCLTITGCDTSIETPADAMYLNGRVYTVNENNDWADAIAVRNGKIVGVGTTEELSRYRGTETDVSDLQGRMLMPGIHDMHNHPVEAGMTERFECGFEATLTVPEILEVVRDCAAKLEPGEWIRGGQWPTALLKSDTPPDKHLLDQVTGEHPVFLMDWAVHNAWLNSMALDRLGITGETPDPVGGQIVRDAESGEATGLLLDNAAYEAQERLPPYTHEQNVAAAQWSVDELVSFGITSFKDAIVVSSNLAAYRELAQTNQLKARVHTSLAWKSAWSPSHQEELNNIRERKTYETDLLRTGFAKIMLDGVPVAYTSALLDPYMPDGVHHDGFRGELMFDPDELKADVIKLDAEGLTVKIHATGDRAARVALDAIQAARETNGDSGLIHEVSHAQFIHPDDIPRFRELSVAAEMCPILWYPGASDAVRASILGKERAERMWPMKTLLEAGALVIYGSDWPAVVPNANPWPGIEAMVTRRNPYGEFPGSQWPEQAITLADAIRIVTQNGALAAKSADLTGSIEVGKAADFIVLDRNIFEIPIDDVGDVQVLMTVVGGKIVFEQSEGGR